MKDWIGNKKSTFVTLGASNHCEHEREKHDYYASDPSVIDDLFAVEQFSDYIWECAAGGLHLSNRMEELGKIVISSDIVDRVGNGKVHICDFLSYGQDTLFSENWGDEKIKEFRANIHINEDIDIITNPPYAFALEFVEKSITLLQEGRKCAMFLKLTFCESEKRRRLFDKYPPKTIYVFSKRRKCAINGDFDSIGSSATCYAWFVWVKGDYSNTELKWI